MLSSQPITFSVRKTALSFLKSHAIRNEIFSQLHREGKARIRAKLFTSGIKCDIWHKPFPDNDFQKRAKYRAWATPTNGP